MGFVALGAGLAIGLPLCAIAWMDQRFERAQRFFEAADRRLFGGDA